MSDLNDLSGLPSTDIPPEIAQPASEDAQALHDELEDLAKVFQEELDRAKEEARAVAENTPADPEIELSAPDEIPSASVSETPMDNGTSPDGALCECCGEKRRGTAENPNSPYCSECDAGLRHYPFDFLNIFFAVIAVCFVFYAGYVFADHTETFVAVQKADSLKAAGKVYDAVDAYAAAANTMRNDHINGELVYKREILLAYQAGFIGELSEVAANIHTWELSLPHFRAVKAALDNSAIFLTTWENAGTIVSQYFSIDVQEIPYDDLIAKLDAMKTAEVVAGTDEDGEPTTAANAYNPEVNRYSAGVIAFFKYRLAMLCEKDLETQIGFLEELQAAEPQYVWLYAPLLSELYAKTGRDIEPLCLLMEQNNTQDNSPALARVIQKRIAGQYEEATALCDKALENSDDLTDEFYRQKALVLLAQGNYRDAYTTVNTAFQNSTSPSFQTVYTVAVCAAAAGEETAYKEVISMLENSGYTVPAEVTGFKDGSVTLNQILFEGDYDIL